jgi:hypothetical protein
MKISVKWYNQKYAELTVEDGNFSCTSSLLNEREREELSTLLSEAANDLRRE